jgi:hypothetical protein
MLLFQAQIMICSWKKNDFSKKEHFWFQKKNIFSTITVLDLNLFFFRVFVLRVYAQQKTREEQFNAQGETVCQQRKVLKHS